MDQSSYPHTHPCNDNPPFFRWSGTLYAPLGAAELRQVNTAEDPLRGHQQRRGWSQDARIHHVQWGGIGPVSGVGEKLVRLLDNCQMCGQGELILVVPMDHYKASFS